LRKGGFPATKALEFNLLPVERSVKRVEGLAQFLRKRTECDRVEYDQQAVQRALEADTAQVRNLNPRCQAC
jgi:hypothetical protein